MGISNENFLDQYVEVDQYSDITLSDSRVTFSTIRRKAISRVNRDYGVGFFEGSWEQRYEFRISAVDSYGQVDVWGVNNQDQALNKSYGDRDPCMKSVVSYSSNVFYQYMYNADTNWASGSSTYSLNTVTFVTMVYTKDGGTNNTGELVAHTCTGNYFGEGGSSLTSTVTLNFTVGTIDFPAMRYVYGLSGQLHASSTQDITGYTQNLNLGATAANYPDTVGSDSGWTNPANSIDSDTTTYTYQEFTSGDDDNYRVDWDSDPLPYASGIKFKVGITDETDINIDVEVDTTSSSFDTEFDNYYTLDANDNSYSVIFNSGTKYLVEDIDFIVDLPGGEATTDVRIYDIYAIAFKPDAVTLSSPADTITNQSISGTLSWTSPRTGGANTVDIYLRATDNSFVDGDRVTVGGSHALVSYNYSGLSPNTAYYWKITSINSDGSTDSAIRSFTTAAAAGQAITPDPIDTATEVDATDLLGWTNGANTTTVNVYLNTFSPPTTQVSTGTLITSFDPNIDYENTYYWRIDSVNIASDITTGTIWSFTTSDYPILKKYYQIERSDKDSPSNTVIIAQYLEGSDVVNYIPDNVGTSTISFNEDPSLLPDGIYCYSVIAYYSNGDSCITESEPSECYEIQVIDGEFVAYPSRDIYELSLTLVAGGKFNLHFRYESINGESIPTSFLIYHNLGGSNDWEVINDYTYYYNIGSYEYVTDTYYHGQEVEFRIFPSKLAFGNTSIRSNDLTVSGIADAEAPELPVIFTDIEIKELEE